MDGQFGLVEVLLKSNRRKDLDVKQLNESLMEETAKPVIEGQDAEKAKQLFDQRERLLQHFQTVMQEGTVTLENIKDMWGYALMEMGISSPVVTKCMMLALASLAENPNEYSITLETYFESIVNVYSEHNDAFIESPPDEFVYQFTRKDGLYFDKFDRD